MATRGIPRTTLGEGASHESFLRHKGFRWLKIALFLCLAAALAYGLIDVQPRPNGGSPIGYALGTIATLLILWLTMLGLRKRAMTRGRWSLKAWTSAHVYLGLSLTVLATLHTGFQFGWNIHTLAYVLMMLVIASGALGIWAYATLPQRLHGNRGETTRKQMIESLESLDRQMHDVAQPLDRAGAEVARISIEDTEIGGGFLKRLLNSYGDCANKGAM